MFVVVEFEHHGLLDDGFGLFGAVAYFIDGNEDLLLCLVVVYADEVAEVGARHGVEHDRVVRDGRKHYVLRYRQVIHDHAAMVGAGSCVSGRLEIVAVERVEREPWSVEFATGYFFIDGFHLAVDCDFNVREHRIKLLLIQSVRRDGGGEDGICCLITRQNPD